MNKIKITTGLHSCKPITLECRYAANHTNNYKVCNRDCRDCEWSFIDINFREDNIEYDELRMIRDLIDKNAERFNKMINRIEVLKFIANKGDEINKIMNKFTSVCNNTMENDVVLTRSEFSSIYKELLNAYSELENIFCEVDKRQYRNPYQSFSEYLSSLDRTIDGVIENKENTDK